MLLQLPRLKDPKIRMRYVSSTHDVDAKELLGTLPNWYVDHLREKGILRMNSARHGGTTTPLNLEAS
ncbi:MAG: hypothetical protein RXO25_06765 [Caldivirga sp.]|jgi:hypothetical protein